MRKFCDLELIIVYLIRMNREIECTRVDNIRRIRGIDAEVRLQNDANRFEPTLAAEEGGGHNGGGGRTVSDGCRRVIASAGGCSTEAVLAGLDSGGCEREELLALCA